MLEFLPESEDLHLGIRVRGKLTAADYRIEMVPRLERIIKEWGRARVLLFLGEDFQGFEAEALKGDAFGAENKNNFERIAVVGGSFWLRMQMKLITPFMSGKVRNFAREDLDQAWEWLKA